ncbi:MAG: hypothetical protein K9G58_05425 [Bacteroidales bacterium]|nr:hypothetical protein [Bacteroidales bacterium]MCF8387608.1 hypothetical protein [Bacteroidales bacterium]MCF8397586.1 hypothetical protein [Bacteroidales bacterium]
MKKLILIFLSLGTHFCLHSQDNRGFATFNFSSCVGQPIEYVYALISGDTLINDTIQGLTLYTPGYYDIYLTTPGHTPVDLGYSYYSGDITYNIVFCIQLFPPMHA